MTFFRDALAFLKRERVWTLLFIFLVLTYVFATREPQKEREEPSRAMEKLRMAETRLKKEIRAEGGVEQVLANRPRLQKAFLFFTGLILITFVSGLAIDLTWLTQSSWRNRLRPATGPPSASRWGLGAVFKAILLFVLASFALSLLLAFFKTILFQGVSANLFVLLHTTLSDFLCIGFALLFIRRVGGNWKDLGFRGIQWVKDLLLGLAGYAAILPLFFLVLFILVIVVQLLAYEPPPHPLVEIFLEEERSPALIAYSLFLACVMGPFFEEIFFRGFCYPAFKKRWGMGWALVLSAAFFSLIHQNAFAFLPVFVLGLGLGYLYEKRGTLVPSIALHIVHNSVFIGYFFLAKEVLMGR